MTEKRSRRVFRLCIALTAVIFSMFALRLADWQLVRGEELRSEAERAAQITVPSHAARGEILDRSGKGLVVNRTHWRLTRSGAPGRAWMAVRCPASSYWCS